MKAEDYLFANRFGVYELETYALSNQRRIYLEEELHEFEEDWYEDSPMPKVCADPDLGTLYAGSGWHSLEDFVIDMLERKDLYRKQIERLKKQEELFNMAVDTLTPRERDIIQIHYFNRENDLGLTPEFFTEILVEAQEKLCSFIKFERVKEKEERRKQQKREIQAKADAIKRYRVHA